MRFWIDEEIFERFPGMRIAVAVAHGLDNRAEVPEVEREWRARWDEARALAEHYPNAQSHPNVAAWRDNLKRVGVSPRDHPSSIEAMLRRAMKGAPAFSINPVVDLLHSVSLRWLVPTGGFDLAKVSEVALRPTAPGDTFTALDDDAPVEVEPGEVAYADGRVVLTRHFVWRQARAALIGRDTTDVFLVSEVLREVGGDIADEVAEALADGVGAYFGVVARTWVLDAGDRAAEW